MGLRWAHCCSVGGGWAYSSISSQLPVVSSQWRSRTFETLAGGGGRQLNCVGSGGKMKTRAKGWAVYWGIREVL